MAPDVMSLSIFVFFSPSDLDGYLRARVGYAVSDTWHVEIGGNLFAGRDDFSFFGQLQKRQQCLLRRALFAMS